MATLQVLVSGQKKGEVYRRLNRWVWVRPDGGKEVYHPRADPHEVLEHIARVCRADPREVTFVRKEEG